MPKPDHHQVTKTPREPISADIDHVASRIVDAGFTVLGALGPGLFESAYEIWLARELVKRDLKIKRQVSVPIVFNGLQFDEGHRLDLIVSDCVMVEWKAVESLLPVQKTQVLTHLKLTGYRLGLWINFNVSIVKMGIKRIAL